MPYDILHEKGISDYYFSETFLDHNSSSHVHSHIEFIFVMSGKAKITMDKKEHVVAEGKVAVTMPYEIHSIATPKHSKAFIIACPPDYMSEYRQILINRQFNPPVVPFGAAARELIADIVNSGFKDDFKKKALLYCTVSEFLKGSTLSDKEPVEFDLYRKSISYITEHFKENLSLASVAQYACVTPAHLSRVINDGSKSSFTDILNSLRIYEAKRLLEQTDISISDAAFEAGYGSIRNFNRIFKKYFGITPKEHLKLKRLRQTNVAEALK